MSDLSSPSRHPSHSFIDDRSLRDAVWLMPCNDAPDLAPPFFARAVPTRLWTHREFAFTLGESTYVRYNSFNSADDFKKEILRANPTRFEIGPVYNARVSGG